MYTLAVGTNATLKCAADANPKVTMVNWTRNGHFVATKESVSHSPHIAKYIDWWKQMLALPVGPLAKKNAGLTKQMLALPA